MCIKYYLLLSVISVISCIPLNNETFSSEKPTSNTQDTILLVVSYDGFRNEYFNRSSTVFMQKFRELNSYADHMLNIFPTKTFPNHHAISTGYDAATHGVTSNTVFDRQLNKKLGYGYELFHYNEDIIPIWVNI